MSIFQAVFLALPTFDIIQIIIKQGTIFMVRVEFLGPIGKEPQELDIDNLSKLAEILKEDESLKEWLECSAIAVNDQLVQTKDFPLKDGDKISLLPPVCGG